MASMTPDILSKKLFWKKKDSLTNNEVDLAVEITKWENLLDNVKKIIIWDNPLVSFLYFVGVNASFWLLTYIELKFYGLIFIALLMVSVNQLWNEHFLISVKSFDSVSGRDSVSSSSDSASNHGLFSMMGMSTYFAKVSDGVRNGCLKIKKFRQERPGMFCVGTCIIFLLLSFIGTTFSGTTILYILLMAIMIVPGVCVHLIPQNFYNRFVNFINSSHRGTESDAGIEDFLPDLNTENRELLRLAGESQKNQREIGNYFLLEQISAQTNDTAESSCSKMSFLPESGMPSVDSSLDFMDFDFTSVKLTGRKGESYESDNSDINLLSKHFNGDTSDEEGFSEGLKFREIEKDKTGIEAKDHLPNILNVASAGYSLLQAGANLFSPTVESQLMQEPKKQERESSSDTDSFELISEEDL